jgi:hypothetical protein
MPVDDLPIVGRYDPMMKREVGAREIYYGIRHALKYTSPEGIVFWLEKARVLFPDHADAYGELVACWISGKLYLTWK